MSDEVRNLDQEIVEDMSSDSEDTSDASSLSFEDMEDITDNEGETQLEQVAEGDLPKQEEKDELPTEGESKSEEITTSEEKSQEEVKEVEETEENQSIEEEIKKLIGKQGEEDVELAANTSFKHKVDGEEVDVELQELLNNYSGKVSYEKKFQELSTTRKDFEEYKNEYDKDIEDIYSVLENFKNSMQDKDALGALNHFAAFAGMPPYEFKQQMIKSLAPEVARVGSMTEEQLFAEKLHSENQLLRQQQENNQTLSRNQQTQRELISQIREIQESHGISDEEFTNSYNELKESDYDGNIDAQAVGVYHVNKMAFTRADSLLQEVNPSLTKDGAIIESLQKVIVENPTFDDNDLKEIVNEVYGEFRKETSKTLSKKAQPKKKEIVKGQSKKQEYLDWEDL